MSEPTAYLDGDTLYIPYSLSRLIENAAVLDAMKRLEEANEPPPPALPAYVLRPGDDPAALIASMPDAPLGTPAEELPTMWVADGIHPYPIHLTKRVNVRALPDADPWFSGWRTGHAWELIERTGVADKYRLRWDRAALGLSHRVVSNSAFLSAQDGATRMAAHNLATEPELVRYDGEPLARVSVLSTPFVAMQQAHDDKNGYLYITLPAGADLDLLEVAMYPQLFTAADGVAGIEVSGITFTGAANTHKEAAFELHSDANTIDVVVEDVNSLAFSVRGIGLTARMRSVRAGQMGHWIKAQKSELTVEHYESNWRGSDAGWHASNKFEQTIECEIHLESYHADGAGCWFDVGNHRNRVGMYILGSGKNALMVEHYAEENSFDFNILDTRPLGRWEGADVQIQSNVKGNTFRGVITGNAIPYWLVYKTAEGRGPSGPNTFKGISASGRPHRIEGGRHEKDIFEDIT